jgi:uncharacterized protein with von Willebrand factor type A (vWA) domain
MSPYEVVQPGGAVEHWNKESGEAWLRRALDHWSSAVWINPVREQLWDYTHSTQMIQQVFGGRMFGMTMQGIEGAMKELSR